MQNKILAVAFLAAIIFLTSTILVTGQLHQKGKCPKVTTQPKLRLKDYFGTWWVYEKYKSYYIEGDHCLTTTYKKLTNHTFSVNFSQLGANNMPRTSNGTGRVVANGQFSEHFESSPPGVNFTFWIIETDYTSYAVMFRCDETADGHDRYLWLLTRDREPNKDAVTAGENAMVAQGLSLHELMLYNQKNCTDIKMQNI